MSGWDAYIAALLGDKSVMTGAAIYGQGQHTHHHTHLNIFTTLTVLSYHLV